MKPLTDGFSADEIGRRKVLLGVLFGSAAAFAQWRLPTKHLDYLGSNKLEDIIPKTIGRWKFVAASGLVVPPEDQLAQTLYTQLLTRVYWDSQNEPVMLLIAQSAGQSGILQVHRPETCYPASGYRISAVTEHDIPIVSGYLKTNVLTADNEGKTEHIVYWVRVGDRIPLTWRQQKLDVAEENLRGIIPDAVLVRISTVNSDPGAARAALDNFTQALVSSMAPARRSVLVA